MTARLALVTGASCGVGFALAEQFARRGYDLMISDGYDEIHTAAAARATQAVTSLAGRLFPDRAKNPVRYIVSPTGEAV